MTPDRERRLLLVSHRPLDYEGPGTVRWRSLSNFLPEHGWAVTAVTARFNPTSDELSADPRVALLSQQRARVMRQVGRMLRPIANRALGVQPEAFPPSMLWSWSGRALIRQKVLDVQPDAVIATAPPFAAFFAVGAVAHGLGVPAIADMRDPWAGHPTYDAGGSLLRRLERRALEPFDRTVVVTPGMLSRLEALHPGLTPKLRMLPNGFVPELLTRRTVPGPRGDSRVRLIHPGVLYGDRSLGSLLAGVRTSGLAERLRLELIGNSTAESQAALRDRPPGLEVLSPGPLSWDDTMDRVADSDVVVVIVPASMGDDVAWPVKMFEALALGKPVLAITSGGAAEKLLRELGQGAGCAREDDAAGVVEALRRVVETPPSPVEPDVLARWDRARVAADYAALLDEVVAERARRASSAVIT